MATAVEILQVIASTDRRGAETFAVDLREAFQESGRHASLVALAPGATGGLDVPVLGPTRFAPGGLAELRRRSRRVGVVVGHGSSTLPACALTTSGTPARFVYRSIGDPAFWARTPLRRARVRLALTRAAGVAALWPGGADALVRLGVPAGRIEVIPNGRRADRYPLVDEERRLAARRQYGVEGAVVALVGALSPEKRVDDAIRAVAALDGVSLLVAGDGPLRDRLARLAADVAPGRVRLLGSVPDTAPVLAAADALVLTSASEGLPGVLIEAGLSGVPAVATAVGGVSTIVEDGTTGVLVPPADPAAVSAALRRVLADGPAMGLEAYRRCHERFEMQSVARRWEAFLNRVAEG